MSAVVVDVTENNAKEATVLGIRALTEEEDLPTEPTPTFVYDRGRVTKEPTKDSSE